MYEATKEFRFEMAHVLSNYDGPCGNLHGHSYRCLVTLGSTVLNDGMVMDFSVVKELVSSEVLKAMDHACAFNINTADPFEKELYNLCKKHNKKIVEFNDRTTAENMCKYIYTTINKVLNSDSRVACTKVELYETTTGHATYSEQYFVTGNKYVD